ncbi:MAG: hypothetical protein QOH97_3666, partial [Actinoplanes sp.]|nr:hypothetical protein [Actinoplanes sp.]
MRRQHTTPNAYPAHLLDELLAVLRRESPAGPGAAALRTRSADARAMLAYAAGDTTVDGLLAAAHRGDTVPGIDPYALGELARVIALQDLWPADRPDGLALFELLLRTYPPSRIAPAHQGLHAQLAFAAGNRARAAELVRLYPELPTPIAESLAVDLADPAGPSWLAAFNRLLPAPGLSLAVPGQSLAEPGRSLAEPGRSLAEPGRSLAEPGQSLTEPGRSLAEPGQSLTEPGLWL